METRAAITDIRAPQNTRVVDSFPMQPPWSDEEIAQEVFPPNQSPMLPAEEIYEQV